MKEQAEEAVRLQKEQESQEQRKTLMLQKLKEQADEAERVRKEQDQRKNLMIQKL